MNEQILKILQIANDTSSRGEGLSLRDAMSRAEYATFRPNLSPADLLTTLKAQPTLTEQWLWYSEDKRSSSGWYLMETGAIGQVGKPESRERFASLEEAVSEYVVRELDFWANVGKAS